MATTINLTSATLEQDLRDAIATPPGDGIITFDGAASGTITLTTGALAIVTSLTIDGDLNDDGFPDVTIDAQGNSRVLTVDNGNSGLANVTIDGLVITGGSAIGGENDSGGGIFSAENLTIKNSDISNNIAASGGGIAIGGGGESTPSLVLTNVTVSGNSASSNGGENDGNGGGIYARSFSGANLTLTNVTISGNSADASGGGIATDDYFGSTVRLSNVTISGNSAAEQGGGLYHQSIYGGLVTLNNVTVSSNTAASASGLYYGGGEEEDGILNINSSILANNTQNEIELLTGQTVEVQEDLISAYGIVNASYSLLETGESYINGTNDSNLFGVDPLLDPNGLQDNGGPTQTIALLPGSPALNTGSNPTNLTTDQRGFARSVGTGTDIGSFELNQAPSITSANAISIEENTTTVTTVTATDPENAPLAYSITGNGADDALFTIDPETGVLSFIAAPDFAAPGDVGADNIYDVQVQVSDGVNAVTQDIAVTVTDSSSAEGLDVEEGDEERGIITLLTSLTLSITLILNNTSFANELVAFVVEDDQGTVRDASGNAITPGTEGFSQSNYLQAILGASSTQVVLSNLNNSDDLPDDFASVGDLEGELTLPAGTRVAFFLVVNGTADDLQSNLSALDVYFSNINGALIENLVSTGFSLSFGDDVAGIFDDLTFEVKTLPDQANNPIAPGQLNKLGKTLRVLTEAIDDFVEVFDFRRFDSDGDGVADTDGTYQVSINIYSEAAYDNLLGFYVINPDDGSVAGIAPSASNRQSYIDAVLANAIGTTTEIQSEAISSFSLTIAAGSVIVPFIIANSSTVNADYSNIYFPFASLNSDGLDHVRSLGRGIFGIEDLPGAISDNDFDDVIIQINSIA